MRLTSASVELLGLNPAGWSAVVGKARLPPGLGVGAFSPDAVELGLVAIIEPADEGTMSRFERVGGIDAHAELFGYTFHAELSGSGLLPAVVEGLGRVVDTTAVGRLTVPHGVPGLAAAEQVLRTLVQPSGKRR